MNGQFKVWQCRCDGCKLLPHAARSWLSCQGDGLAARNYLIYDGFPMREGMAA